MSGRKVKYITVTPQNFNWVLGKLTKFFSHKRFSTTIAYDKGNTKRFNGCFRRMNRNFRIKVIKVFNESFNEEPCAVINYDYEEYYSFHRKDHGDCSTCVRIGDCVAFCGNRIILKKKEIISDRHEYCYSCYQIESVKRHCDVEYKPLSYLFWKIV